jgi:hypothetical protein
LTGTGRKSGKNQAHKEKGKYQSAHGYPLGIIFLLLIITERACGKQRRLDGFHIGKIAYRPI